MSKKLLSVVLVVLLIGTLLIGCSQGSEDKAETIKLKMSVTPSENSTWTKGAEMLAKLVKENSNGEMEIEIYPNEELSGGDQGKGIAMVRDGSTDLSFHSNIIYSTMDERFGVISLPWLFPDYKTVDVALAGEGGAAINELLDQVGIVGLGFGENGFRQITNNKRVVANPEDLVGLKIRIPGIKMYNSLYKLLGADPISMNFSEVFTALQEEAIDGQENPIDVIDSSKIYQAQKYLAIWNYSYDAIILGMNKEKFDSLSVEHQNILKEAAVIATEYQVNTNREAEGDQITKFEAEGMTVTRLSSDQIETFKEKVQPIYTEYEPIIGKDLIDIFR